MKNKITFEKWWHNIGSGITPNETDDMEEHAKRVAYNAWMEAIKMEKEK